MDDLLALSDADLEFRATRRNAEVLRECSSAGDCGHAAFAHAVDETDVTSRNRARSFVTFPRLLAVALTLFCGASVASAVTADASLRWIPSPSSDVTGYVVHVGDQPGFYGEGVVVAEIDIGMGYTVEDGVAQIPLSSVTSQSAWVVMTAYGAGGLESTASNEIYAEVLVGCVQDADCDDGDFCNGPESCSGGSCVGGAPPACSPSDVCTVASCDPLAGCVADPAADGLWCDDGDFETFGDTCSAGECHGQASSDVNSEPFYFEDFEASSNGSDPVGWLDTAAGSVQQLADDFQVAVLGNGNHVLRTTSTATNIHSHMMEGGSDGWYGYELSGRMQITASSGAIGVTIYSGYPNSDTYYRLRREGGTSFRLAPHPDGNTSCVGDNDTGVVPLQDSWYDFRFRAFPEEGGTRVQARVWVHQDAEPNSWQASCFDSAATALIGGSPGVWSAGTGAKHWDDIAARYVSTAEIPVPEPDPECSSDSDCTDGDACNGAERCASGICVAGAPLVCSGSQECRVATCDPELGCVMAAVPNGSSCDDQDLCTGQDSCQSGSCTGGAALSCPAPNACQAGSCDPQSGCSVENLPDGSLCDDGDAATVNDACRLGSCSGELEPECDRDTDCGDGNVCNGSERCSNGSCIAGAPLACSGSHACGVATCEPLSGCVIEPVPNGTPCDDQDLCTGQDSCQSGSCTGGAALSCPAPNACQVGSCDSQSGCSVENLPDGRQCDDGDPSTEYDVCRAGDCSGEAVVEPVPDVDAGLMFEDFEEYAHGADPEGWLDTGANNSLAEDPRAFEVIELSDGNRVLGAKSRAADIHSHYVGDESAHWSAYEYRGRMFITARSGGVGVTLFSDYPNSDSYYRLRRHGRGAFHLASHPDDVVACVGSTNTGVRPSKNTWYRFRFQAEPEGAGTRVRARVWAVAEDEPGTWQVDCLVKGFGTFFSGSPGVWSMGRGKKYWDDLEVVALAADGSEPGEVPPGDTTSDALYFEDFEAYASDSDAAGWLDSGTGNSLVEDPSLLSVIEQSDGNRALGTTSAEADIHSHLVEAGSDAWSNYEFSGRMQISQRNTGIGLTLYSEFPTSDRYYRLRRFAGTTFHLSGHPESESSCTGRTNIGILPYPNRWYRFRFQAFSVGAATQLRAKVWLESHAEPDTWQIDCAAESGIALRGGRPGIWATGGGTKLWDDLEIREIP